MERIALAKGEVELKNDQVELLQKVLDNVLKIKRASTFLIGRLYGLLDGKTAKQKEDDKCAKD